MHRHLLLATVSVLSLGMVSAAMAASDQEPAFNKGDKPIYATDGHCVRTKWQEGIDPCAPAAPPAPVVVRRDPPPAPAPVVVAAPLVSQEQRTVYFDFNKATLNAAATAKLDQLADIINKSTAITDVVIHGFTDQIGSNSYNDALASKRADAVKAYLDSKSRLQSTQGDIRGLGKSPTDGHCLDIKKRTEKIDCMSNQRRVEVEFKAQE